MKFFKRRKKYILILYVFLIFIHFIVKDRFYPLSILFYPTPLIFITIFGVIVSFLFFKRKVIFLLLISTTIALSGYWYRNYYFNTIASENIKTETILFWNLARKKETNTKVLLNYITIYNPNIIAFVEAKNITKNDLTTLNATNAYNFKVLKGQMIIGVKGQIDSVYYKSEDNKFKINYIDATINNRKIKILVADLFASSYNNKALPLKELLEFSKNNTINVLVGDFNTPYESVHFNNLKKDFTSFHSFSKGFSATWPYGIPLLELDQIWVDKSFTPIILEKFQHKESDHKLLIGKYKVN